MRSAAPLVVLAALASAATAKDPYKAGWTGENIAVEVEACSRTLVQGAWENTKRDQHLDPALPMTPEIRDQLAPQITAMGKLCDCAVREAAKKYTYAQAEDPKSHFESFTSDVVKKGKCKLEQTE